MRSVDARDFPACRRLIEGHLGYPRTLLTKLTRVWARLLRDDALNGFVAEHARAGRTKAIMAFGASVFVTEAWMACARASEEPYLTARTLHGEIAASTTVSGMSSKPSPILRPAAIAREDGRGLNVVILHGVETRDRLAEDERLALRFAMLGWFIDSMRGYRINAVIQEFWDELDPQFIVNGWGRVLTDYAPYFARRGEAVPPLGRGPILTALTREEIARNPGGIASPLFVHRPPRLQFTRAEQRLLREALSGRTDLELARELRLTLPTITSRWRGIYNRVGLCAPDVLPDMPADGTLAHGTPPATRRQEKRRRLLDYLRRHPEELRAMHVRARRASS